MAVIKGACGHYQTALWFLLALCVPGWSGAQSEITPIPVDAAQSKSAAVCSIIGDVQFPGSFAFRHSPLNLNTLIGRAGGIDAGRENCVIKIVRQGFLVHHVNYRPGKSVYETHLKANDIVIASAGETAGGADGALHDSPAKVSYIAISGLLESPLILPLFDRTVKVGTLLKKLNQSPECVNHLKIIHADGRQFTYDDRKSFLKLTDGMVLAFDSATVNRASLPRIPQVTVMPDTIPTNVRLASRVAASHFNDPVNRANLTQSHLQSHPRKLAGSRVNVALSPHENALSQAGMDSTANGVHESPLVDGSAGETQVSSSFTDAADKTAYLGVLLLLGGLIWLSIEYRHRLAAYFPSRWERYVGVLVASVSPVWIKSQTKSSSTGILRASEPALEETPSGRSGKQNPRILMQLQKTND